MTPKPEKNNGYQIHKPEPHPADYCDDLSEEFFQELDKHADQEDLESNSDMVRCFDWKR